MRPCPRHRRITATPRKSFVESLNRVRLVATPQIQAGSSDVDCVRLDLIAKQTSRLPVQISRDFQPLGDVLEVRNQHERDATLFLPRHGGDLCPSQEARVGPDAVAVKAPGNLRAERQRISVVDEHHRLAEQRLNGSMLYEQLEDEQQPEHHAERKAESVELRLLALPHEQSRSFSNSESNEIDDDQDVRNQEPDAEKKKNSLQQDLKGHETYAFRDSGLGIRDSEVLGSVTVSASTRAAATRSRFGSKHARQRAS